MRYEEFYDRLNADIGFDIKPILGVNIHRRIYEYFISRGIIESEEQYWELRKKSGDKWGEQGDDAVFNHIVNHPLYDMWRI